MFLQTKPMKSGTEKIVCTDSGSEGSTLEKKDQLLTCNKTYFKDYVLVRVAVRCAPLHYRAGALWCGLFLRTSL
jgi:hypothetical protein